MNILFLTFLYPYEDETYFGVFIKEHAKAIKLVNPDINVLACRIRRANVIFKKRTETFIDESGMSTHFIHIESFFYKLIYAFPPLLYLICLAYTKQKKIITKDTIIHSNIIAPCGIVGYWLSKKYSTIHVITEHWSKIDKFMKFNVFKGIARKAYREAKCVTAVSEFLSKSIKAHALPGTNILVIPNVIDNKIFKYVPKGTNEKIVFTAVAKWVYPKLPFMFCDALHQVSALKKIHVELNMVGSGHLAKVIEETRNKYGFEINFLGELPKNKIADLLSLTDYFLHASEIETFSVVVAEALCTGTPVIVSNVGALPELVDESNGVLCSNTISAWVNGISEAIEKKYDGAGISSICSQKLSLDTIGMQFLEVYKRSSS